MKKRVFKWFIFSVLMVAVIPLVFCFMPVSVARAESYDYSLTMEGSLLKGIHADFENSNVKNTSDAFKFLNNFKSELGTSSKEALVFNKAVPSITGTTYRFNQIIDGIKVFDAELILSVNRDGKVTDVSGLYYTDRNYDKTNNYSLSEAKETVLEKYKSASVYEDELYIFDKENGGMLAYLFDVDDVSGSYKVFVSAKDGVVVKEVSSDSLLRDKLPTTGYTISSETKTSVIDGKTVSYNMQKYTSKVNGASFYVLYDPVRRIYMTNGQNKEDYTYKYYDSQLESGAVNDNDAIKAYMSLIKCYDFYADESSFGIVNNGIKNVYGQTIDLIAIVHFGEKYENAGYAPPGTSSTGYFVFGDGNVLTGTKSFVNGVDIVGHEYQHAFTSQVCNFVYEGESGALSEAFSDMFGAVIEGKGIASKDFWKMGEDVIYPKYSVFRDMSNPASTGCAYNYSSYKDNLDSCKVGSSYVYNDNNDNGKIHYNCTLPTYATYLMYSEAPEFFTEYRVLQLWYQTLTKLTKTSGLSDFCSAMVKAANDLNYTTSQRFIIESAFAKLGIPGYTGVETWNGNSLTILRGEGNIVSPYLISSTADLASLAYHINNGDEEFVSARYKLANDITVSANVDWISIGTEEHPFNGYFNGAGNTIKFSLNMPSTSFSGLFGYIGEDGFVYDLNMAGSKINTTSEYSGAIAGVCAGELSGCSSSLGIAGDTVGGLVGLMLNVYGGQKIVNSYATSILKGDVVGGLVGVFDTSKNTVTNTYLSGYISSCYFSGGITSRIAGGLVGVANGIMLINSISMANIDAMSNSNSVVGGLVGRLIDTSVVSGDSMIEGYNFILSCRAANTYYSLSSEDNAKLLVGEVTGNKDTALVYFKDIIVKKSGNIKAYLSTAEAGALIEENLKLSSSPIFSLDFDFDSEAYYENTSWINIDGSIAFDMVSTFKVGENSMPVFKKTEYWLDHASSYLIGDGTAANPYKISSGADLACLANIFVNEKVYKNYADKYYVLTSDIDLSGKLWAGIGTTKYSYVKGALDDITYFGFKGHFDGGGHTIRNMTTMTIYLPDPSIDDATTYDLYEFSSGLFGLTELNVTTNQNVTSYVNPEIKNLTLQNVKNTGNYAAGVVSRAHGAITLDNVSVINAIISSSGVAAGLVGKIDGRSAYSRFSPVSNIKSSYFEGKIYGIVAGGAVGYTTNASQSTLLTTANSTINIINFLMRGSIIVNGINKEATYTSQNGFNYYRPVAGSVIGLAGSNKINITNSINMANIISYMPASYLGGFVGASIVGDPYKSREINITIVGSKQMGDMFVAFDKTLISSGCIIGGTHEDLKSFVKVSVDDKTYLKQMSNEIYKNNADSLYSITFNGCYTTSEISSGDFDIYNEDYFKNEKYFDQNYAWSEQDIGRLFFKVEFYNNGVLIKTQYLKEGESATAPTSVSRDSDVAYHYTFSGWDKDFTSVHGNLTINALYERTLREYTVTFLDALGNEIEVKTLKYGTVIDGLVTPPKKDGNFFVNYEFVRWGEKGQTVSGDMTVKPVYRMKLTTASSLILIVIAIILFMTLVIVISKKSRVKYSK